MESITARHAVAWALALGVTVLGAVGFLVADAALYSWPHFTGWTLLAVFVLTFFYAKRRVLRLAASTVFLIHLHLGWMAVLLFASHAGGAPRGAFGLLLWTMFVLLLASGVVGLICEKSVFLWQRDWGALPYTRIASKRTALAAEATEIYQRLLMNNEASYSFARHYAWRLVPFFSAAANFWAHWVPFRRPINDILLEMDHVSGDWADNADYLRLRALVGEKDDLDRRRALFWLQRGWLFVHLPAAAMSAVLIVAHIILVYAFGG